ncbi:uncharacterized protein LOC124171614 isoform X2 [Ischnura elegans]|uniref:uncharacterized protein LOC124171614 isoform X2 n=1 Tax=Ischnura elegans TaxID=197161 RepID=UPI001ED8A727|nr:uncharacterized protein LOC124171614 isoform X2 [Ischnura elegans]
MRILVLVLALLACAAGRLVPPQGSVEGHRIQHAASLWGVGAFQYNIAQAGVDQQEYSLDTVQMIYVDLEATADDDDTFENGDDQSEDMEDEECDVTGAASDLMIKPEENVAGEEDYIEYEECICEEVEYVQDGYVFPAEWPNVFMLAFFIMSINLCFVLCLWYSIDKYHIGSRDMTGKRGLIYSPLV